MSEIDQPNEVRVSAREHMALYINDEFRPWFAENEIERDEYLVRSEQDHSVRIAFRFKDVSDAVLFKMRWL